jgi:hypothetical protein
VSNRKGAKAQRKIVFVIGLDWPLVGETLVVGFCYFNVKKSFLGAFAVRKFFS